MSSSALKAHMSVLKAHKNRLSRVNIVDLFSKDTNRFSKFSISLDKLLFDYSKNRIDSLALKSLLALAKSASLEKKRNKMFQGDVINRSENRAALHTALRQQTNDPVLVDGNNVIPEIKKVQRALSRFARQVRNGSYNLSGRKITDIVNIGIGGSDLGPAMTSQALKHWHKGPRTHFVSNIDGAALEDVLELVEPETTLFIIASKSFTTQETMVNAHSARKWLQKKLSKKNVGEHFVALSTNIAACEKFGISKERIFGFWDFVGGRYSIWSAIGLSLMIAIGPKHYNAMLAGANLVDNHFLSAPLNQSIPVIMGLIGIWHRNIWGYESQAVLPYDNRLSRFPAYLQQLEMESNGKRVTSDGKALKYDTVPVIWGASGTNGQHAFYQMLHQGTTIVPCDFLIAIKPNSKFSKHQDILAANCFAQSDALMIGRSLKTAKAELMAKGFNAKAANQLAPHKVFEGNRPTNTFVYDQLTPKTLGMLIALYEHKTFVEGVIWGVNSFDQWGVELGKVMASDIEQIIKGKKSTRGLDSSTKGLLDAYMQSSN